MGESGENSNVWYAEFISSCEKSNIGWSFWPVKKNGLNNVLYVKINEGYEKLVNRSMSKTSDPVETFDAVMQWAENHKIQNCEVKYDVLDAMLRQPLSEETIPFVKHNALDTISFSDYDLGRIGFAYSDKDFANYGGDFVPWNTGWNYRSDGVDIESCSDLVSNGYSVGWTSKDEWMVFTLEIDSTAVYSFDIRYAASPASGKFQLQLDGIEISNIESLKSTGDWYNWATHTVQDIILTKGKHQLKFYIVDAGFNLNYFRFYNPSSLTAASAEFLQIKTDEPGETIQLVSNLGYMANELPTANDFELLVNNKMVSITDISIDVQNPKILNLKTSIALIKADKLTLSYLGTSLKSPEGKGYPTFTKRSVVNNSPFYFVLPTRIQAEDFKVNNGFQLENCEDTGGGFNLSYASSGDYADYQVYLSEAGKFQFEYRVASGNSGSFKMKLITEEGETDLHIISASTGGWQKWQSKTATANLPAGKFTLRIYVLSGEFNLNWFRISVATSNLIIEENMNELVVTYSMKGDILTIHNSTLVSGKGTLELFNSQGQKVIAKDFQLYGDRSIEIPVNKMSKGVYFTRITMGENRFKQRFLVN